MKSFESLGLWWLPEAPERKIPGKLTFKPETGGLLALLGILAEDTIHDDPSWSNSLIIHGRVKDPEGTVNVTLQDCWRIMTGRDPNGFSESEYAVEWVVKGQGCWFADVQNSLYQELNLSFTYLNSWMFQPTVNSVQVGESDDNRKPIELRLPFADLVIWPTYSRSNNLTEISIKYGNRIAVIPHDKSTLSALLRLTDSALRSFITLATGHVNYPLDITGVTGDGRFKTDIFYHMYPYHEGERQMSRNDKLFTFEEVKNELGEMLSRWILKFDSLNTVYSLFFNACHQARMDTATSYLDLVRALEVYDRILGEGEYLSEAEYQPILDAIQQAIPAHVSSQHRESLAGRLKHGYQYSLRTRLKRVCNEVLSEQNAEVSMLLGDPNAFIHRVVSTRNHLTHLDGEPSDDVLQGKGLRMAIQQLRLLLQMCFLKEMGMSAYKMSKLLNGNYAYALTVGRRKRTSS